MSGRRSTGTRLSGAVIAASLVALAAPIAGCGALNRVATLGETTPRSVQVSGATVDHAVEKELAGKGLPNATVSCPTTLSALVGEPVTCTLSRAGAERTVTFTFSTVTGQIDPSSVTGS